MTARLMALKILTLSLIVSGSPVFPATDAVAFFDRKLDQEAFACAGSYSRYPAKVLNGKNRDAATCAGGRRPMSRSEAYERCRSQFSATSLLLNWTSKGWRCRYYGH